ncbi:hypothetical protein WR25_04955 [Diploscapter pachys]|uniref:RING-type domain-containing protein n=1 Tax=Diploscapter pachys TaxID=2018661 RepID=A0A2A2JR54_9BILA|nr:hypothetical protein WR25_04955 [Diploscapter pachys]
MQKQKHRETLRYKYAHQPHDKATSDKDACICCTEYRAAIRAEPCGHWISCGPCFVNIFENSLKNPYTIPACIFCRTPLKGVAYRRKRMRRKPRFDNKFDEMYRLSNGDYFFGERFNERPVTIRTENIMAEEDWIRMGRPYVNKEIVTGNTCSSSKSTESYMTIGSFGHSTIGNTNDSTCTQSTNFSTITSKSL